MGTETREWNLGTFSRRPSVRSQTREGIYTREGVLRQGDLYKGGKNRRMDIRKWWMNFS